MATHLQATQGRDMAAEGDAGQENPFPASRGWKKVSDPGYKEWSRAFREIYFHFYIPHYLPNKEAYASGVLGFDDVNKHRLKYEAEKKEAEERELALTKQLEHLFKDDPLWKKPRMSVGTEDQEEDEEDDDDDEEEDDDEGEEGEEIELPLQLEK